MLNLSTSCRILLFAAPTDMRKGHNGLYALVKMAGQDPCSGDLFVFLSKSRDRAKIFTFERGGFVLWYKRLEKGRFRHPQRGEANVELDATSLAMLLDGIDLGKVKRPELWSPKKKTSEKSQENTRSGIDKVAQI